MSASASLSVSVSVPMDRECGALFGRKFAPESCPVADWRRAIAGRGHRHEDTDTANDSHHSGSTTVTAPAGGRGGPDSRDALQYGTAVTPTMASIAGKRDDLRSCHVAKPDSHDSGEGSGREGAHYLSRSAEEGNGVGMGPADGQRKAKVDDGAFFIVDNNELKVESRQKRQRF